MATAPTALYTDIGIAGGTGEEGGGSISRKGGKGCSRTDLGRGNRDPNSPAVLITHAAVQDHEKVPLQIFSSQEEGEWTGVVEGGIHRGPQTIRQEPQEMGLSYFHPITTPPKTGPHSSYIMQHRCSYLRTIDRPTKSKHCEGETKTSMSEISEIVTRP